MGRRWSQFQLGTKPLNIDFWLCHDAFVPDPCLLNLIISPFSSRLTILFIKKVSASRSRKWRLFASEKELKAARCSTLGYAGTWGSFLLAALLRVTWSRLFFPLRWNLDPWKYFLKLLAFVWAWRIVFTRRGECRLGAVKSCENFLCGITSKTLRNESFHKSIFCIKIVDG